MKITKAEYLVSGVKKDQFPSIPSKMYAFLGRSNVGKSSFINGLTNRKNLAYTSSKPGKTITLNFFNINDSILFVDVPGYGYAERTKDERIRYGKMMEELCINNERLECVFLIMDIRHDPTEDDSLMVEWLKFHQVNFKIILTKADKIGKTLIQRYSKPFIQKYNLEREDYYVVSSLTKYGFEDVLKVFD